MSSGGARLLKVEYGRLVDVFGFVRDAGEVTMQLFRRDVVIGPDIIDQRQGGAQISDAAIQYDFLNANPDNLQLRLLIPREIDGAEFLTAFDALDDNLRQINAGVFGQNPSRNNPFSVMPRNASLRLSFSAALGVDDRFFYSLDASTGRITGIRNTEAVQLLEIVGDPDDARDRGDFIVIPSRVVVRAHEIVIDPVLLGSEGIQLQVQNNAAGLPESADQVGANIRLAIALDGPLAMPRITVGSDVAFVGKNNSATRSIVRDFRSGNFSDQSADISHGFIRDPNPLRIIGELPMFLEQTETVGTDAQLITLFKGGIEHEIDRGDVVRILDPGSGQVFASVDVISDPLQDHGRQHVDVLVRRIPGLESIDPSNRSDYPAQLAQREGWLRLNAPRVIVIAEFTASRRDARSGAVSRDDPANFIRFTPEPLPQLDGTPSPGNENISPFAGVIIRFNKPVDMRSARPLDSFFLATRNVLDEEVILHDFVSDPARQIDAERFFPDYLDKFITPHLVASYVFDEDGSQTVLRLQPTLGMYLDAEMRSIDEGQTLARKRFPYVLHILGGEEGLLDLAGNPVDFQSAADVTEFLAIPFSLDTRSMSDDPSLPLYTDNLVVSVARRFADVDEDEQPSVYRHNEVPVVSRINQSFAPHLLARVDDVFGEASYLSDGRLLARGTLRSRKVVDNLNQQAPPTQSGPGSWCPPQVAGLFASRAMTVSATAQNPLGPGIQNPLNPFGARLQAVWREIDFGLSRVDPADFNLDVEQMYWAPAAQAPITFDEFDRVSLYLGHSEHRPEPCLGVGDALPFFFDSGLTSIFADNYAFNLVTGSRYLKDDPPAPHSAYVGSSLSIDATKAITEPNGINRYLSLPEFQEPYFVWRDETSNLQGGAVGIVNGTILARAFDTLGQRYAPYIRSPFLGGGGRRVTRAADRRLVTNTGYWGNAGGGSLRGSDLADPSVGRIGSSARAEFFTGGTVGSIALPLLADFQTFPDDPDLPLGRGFIATGFNGWQVSVPVQSSPYPFFRAYSGGFAGSGAVEPILVSPRTLPWRRARGGFQQGGQPACIEILRGGINEGAVICGLDNSVYWVMADFLKRQSVVTSGFVEVLNPHRMPPRMHGSGDPRLGPYFSSPSGSVALPVGVLPSFGWQTEPSLDALPSGTSIVPEFRAASRLENDLGVVGDGQAIPEGYWRWGFHEPRLAGNPAVPNGFTTDIYRNAERPDEVNFALNPLVAGDAHIRKWDERILPPGGQPRDHWAYYYNRQVTDYTTNIGDLSDDRFLRDFVGDREVFGPREVKYFNWRFIMRNNVEANPPVSPSLESFAVTYRFEKR